jgi:hypothetical protein
MSANRSSEEVTRQMWGRFDGSNSAEGNRHQTRRDARVKEVATEVKHQSKRNNAPYAADFTGDLGDMGENDSFGG